MDGGVWRAEYLATGGVVAPVQSKSWLTLSVLSVLPSSGRADGLCRGGAKGSCSSRSTWIRASSAPARLSKPVAPRLADRSRSLPCTWAGIQSSESSVRVEGSDMLIAWRGGVVAPRFLAGGRMGVVRVSDECEW